LLHAWKNNIFHVVFISAETTLICTHVGGKQLRYNLLQISFSLQIFFEKLQSISHCLLHCFFDFGNFQISPEFKTKWIPFKLSMSNQIHSFSPRGPTVTHIWKFKKLCFVPCIRKLNWQYNWICVEIDFSALPKIFSVNPPGLTFFESVFEGIKKIGFPMAWKGKKKWKPISVLLNTNFLCSMLLSIIEELSNNVVVFTKFSWSEQSN